MPRKTINGPASVPAPVSAQAAPSGRFIRTKLSPPRPSRRTVRREGVIGQLNLGVQRTLTVLRAPAGFGKTTVLADWREHLIADHQRVAWVTLDADDNDPGQFVSYLAKALSDALGGLAEGLPEFCVDGEIASPKISLTSIINALSAIDAELVLILDDYERIKAAAVHDLLAFLLLHAPANLHLVVATRVEPPLPLAYLRAHDELVEIDAACMRFGIEDTRCFLGDVAALKLDAGQTRALHEATEGWAAGLQIAAISLRGHGDATSVIASFSGKSRAVNEYLADSVLPNLDQVTIDFLLRTSILERLTAAVCAHLTDVEDGAGMLLWLNQQNLFLHALDDEGRWYRHHALFADFLRAQLERRYPHQVRGLHERAAQWFAEQGLWSEAVRHALAAERLDLAAQWVELCAMREVEDSRVRNLLAWVRKLPDSAVRPRLRLRVAVAWASLLTIQLDDAMRIVDDVSTQIAEGEFPFDEALDAELLALRFCITALQDDTAAALILGERYLARVRAPMRNSDNDAATWAHQAALNGLTHCYQKAGKLAQARAVQQPEWYPPSPNPRRNLFTNSYRATTLGACDIREARLTEGARHCRAALQLAEANAGRRSAAATLVACSLAAVHYEWNDLDEVEQLLADRLDIVDDACYLDSVRSAYLSLARLFAARGDYEAAHTLLDRGQLVATRRRWPRLTAVCLAEQVRLWLLQQRPREAERALLRLESLTPSQAPPSGSAQSETWRVRCIGRARWLLYQNRADEAVTLLRGVLADENPATSPYPTARTRLLLAIALDRSGRAPEALDETGDLLHIAELAGMIRSIADEGAASASLVQRFFSAPERASALPRTGWRDRLFASLNLSETATPAVRAEPQTAVIEPLSQREREVLSLVAQGLSNEQTARTLMLATETVKWHLKNVYSKLGVSRRTLAVHRARQLDLIVEKRIGH